MRYINAHFTYLLIFVYNANLQRTRSWRGKLVAVWVPLATHTTDIMSSSAPSSTSSCLATTTPPCAPTVRHPAISSPPSPATSRPSCEVVYKDRRGAGLASVATHVRLAVEPARSKSGSALTIALLGPTAQQAMINYHYHYHLFLENSVTNRIVEINSKARQSTN